MIIIFVLSGCSEEENMDAQEESATEEEISLKDIKIPSTIFTSEKTIVSLTKKKWNKVSKYI